MLPVTLVLPCFLVMLPLLGSADSLQAGDDKILGQTSQSAAKATGQALNGPHAQGERCEMGEMNQAILEHVNNARSQARLCGEEKFEAAAPLTWNCKLEAAARAHTKDMAEKRYFSHTSPGGTGIRERVNSEDYDWIAVGENIAAGQPSASAVVRGWLSSPGHCSNIMNANFTEMGAAKVEEPGSRYSPYWTQVLAKPR